MIPSSWSLFFEGGFAKYGELLRIMTGSLRPSMKHESESGFIFIIKKWEGSRRVEPGWRCPPPSANLQASRGERGEVEKPGRRSQGGDGGARIRAHQGVGGIEEENTLIFCEECVIPSSWSLFFEGGFAKYGELLRIMTGI